MKITKLLAFLLVFLFASQLGMASSVNNTSVVQTKPSLSYNLDLGDITDMDFDQVSLKIDEFLKTSLPTSPEAQELTCSVTVEGTLSAKFVELKISVTVSGPCSEVVKAGKTIATMVLNEVKSELSKII